MKKILLVGLVLFGLIQIIPYGHDYTNPEVKSIVKWDSKKTEELFNKACADCHSNNTKWPWYSKIAPISWLVAHDVAKGREHFNVSMIGYQKKNEADEAYEELEDGEMPPAIYVLNHPEAKLSKEETLQLIKGLKATFKYNEK
jgi:mono/diheme cytochrome c family protein